MLPPVFQTLKASQAVKDIVGTNPPRIYRHGSAPQDTIKPYITWSLVSSVPTNNLSDLPGMDWCQVQIDCWYPSSPEGDAAIERLAEAVRDALEQVTHVTAILLDLKDPETKFFRIAIQADFWVSRG